MRKVLFLGRDVDGNGGVGYVDPTLKKATLAALERR
jgi:hypothetical protein